MGWLDKLLPDENDPIAMRRWRICHSGLAWFAALGLIFYVTPVFFAVPFTIPRVGTVAWANDIDARIDNKIQAAVKPIADTQHEQAKQLETIATLLKRQSNIELLKSVLLAKKEQCEARRDRRSSDYWDDQLIKLRDEYREATGQPPDVPTSCEGL